MNKKIKISLLIIILIMAILIVNHLLPAKEQNQELIKIGIITDLTGPAAYWGESALAGAELALEELKADGYNVEFIYEDYQLKANNALSAAQKLINVDQVEGIYSEFIPAALSVGSFTKDLNVLHVYDAAPISPLKDASNTYKTYLDYQAGCKGVAQKFKNQGIAKIGMLKVNAEYGELCLAGINEVYDEVMVENYNLGDKSFNTHVLKLKEKNIKALFNVGFEGDTLNSLKALNENGLDIPFGTVDDTISENVLNKYPEQIKNITTFGFKEIDPKFSEKLKEKFPNKKFSTEYGAGFAYTHLIQMVKAIVACDKESQCVRGKIDQAKSDQTIGFIKFNNHVAEIEINIKQY